MNSQIPHDLFPIRFMNREYEHRDTGQEILYFMDTRAICSTISLASILCRDYIWRFMHILGVNYAASPSRNLYRRLKVEINFNRWNISRDIMLICGHTHRPKFPREGEPAYFNTGCCIHPRGIYCLELICGNISLVSWRMHSKKDGTLFVKRTIVQGPEPIIKFQNSLAKGGYRTMKITGRKLRKYKKEDCPNERYESN